MSHNYRNAAAFSRAQATYDNMSPPEGGPCECCECNGKGSHVVTDADGDGWDEPCKFCDGTGKTDEDGNPWTEPEDDGERYDR